MNQQEHINMALELTERAGQEAGNSGGNTLVAAELLWGKGPPAHRGR